ncbi:uncharacterized protein MELLADRAFT_85386 [Melampsora larici-populina 98AG31]|uniref:F-box domain-containing protein n=1 Tax=Melampsora larici-populina (strain 98AG31 / pathotype 3-4-7) TaxID=747676 RepID=F4RII1_MELLP|nr:uncharacterized protein MELLADRAFT_85386 [Melampsora larici-populina 98AG31]EGG07829.1 hypothetical protein MELLADRAFT_85386 [Melampsora larici-populina 98AG31]
MQTDQALPDPVVPPNHLPPEILGLILNHVVPTIPVVPYNSTCSTEIFYFRHDYVFWLLRLRLLNRFWNSAILPIVFDTVCLTRNNMSISLARMWTKCSVDMHCPRVTNLYLDGIWYSKLSTPSLDQPDLTYSTTPYPFSILLEDAVEIVALCGSTLVNLKLRFMDSVGFPPVMSDAIQGITRLKVLSIQGPTSPQIKHDSESLKTLLEGIPSLESLSISLPSLRKMHLKPGSLPLLTHFWIANHRQNRRAAMEICQEGERSIDCLELFTQEKASTATGVASGLTNSLKVLFILSVPDRVPHDLRNLIFPNLRVLRGEYCNPTSRGLSWLEWPVLKTVEVFITTYWHGSQYWRAMFEHDLFASVILPENLKHFVFIRSEGHGPTDEFLVNLFEAIGIKCHFMGRLTRAQTTGLADQLRCDIAK